MAVLPERGTASLPLLAADFLSQFIRQNWDKVLRY